MWDPRAVIVLILALAVAVGHVTAVVLAAWQGKSVGEVGGDVLTAVLGAVLAIIAAYVGRRNGVHDAKQESDRHKPLADDTEGPGGDQG